MPFPQPNEYNEAIQNLRSTVSDAELRQGEAAVNAMGVPMPSSGNFADVYKVHCPATGNTWAVKCFTREAAGLKERYRGISEHLKKTPFGFMVEFHYIEPGIRIGKQSYPFLKMRWVEGLRLNQFVSDYLDKPKTLKNLLPLWVKLSAKLRQARIAHGDLQHGNVLLVPVPETGQLGLKLIDYDGMYVPALAKSKSGEVGHPCFQHPQRIKEAIYNADMDRFSHLAIYTAIQAAMVGKRELWDKFDNGDNLLFRETDFKNPETSDLFRRLWETPSQPELHSLAGRLILACKRPLNQCPHLDELVFNGAVLPLSPELETKVDAMIGAAGPAVQTAPQFHQPVGGTFAAPQPAQPAQPVAATYPLASLGVADLLDMDRPSSAGQTSALAPRKRSRMKMGTLPWVLGGAAVLGLLVVVGALAYKGGSALRETVSSVPASAISPPAPGPVASGSVASASTPTPPLPGPGESGPSASGPASSPPPVRATPNAGSQTIDLLALVQPAKHTANGVWELGLAGLTTVRKDSCSLILPPVIPEGSFELETEFTRSAGDGCAALLFPVGDSFAFVEVSGWHGRFSGLSYINGAGTDSASNPTARPSTIRNGVRYKLSARVQYLSGNEVQISGELDGTSLFRWQGPMSAFTGSTFSFWHMPRPATVGLGTDTSLTVFHTARLRMLDGQARSSDGSVTAATLPTPGPPASGSVASGTEPSPPSPRRPISPFGQIMPRPGIPHPYAGPPPLRLPGLNPVSQHRSGLVGGYGGGGDYQNVSPKGLVAVVTYRTGSWDNKPGFGDIQCLPPGTTAVGDNAVVARDGYVMGGIRVDGQGEVFFHAMQIVFMKLRADGRLDTKDTYNSDWIGTPTGKTAMLASDGPPVVGVYGRRVLLLHSIGLILAGESATPGSLAATVPPGEPEPPDAGKQAEEQSKRIEEQRKSRQPPDSSQPDYYDQMAKRMLSEDVFVRGPTVDALLAADPAQAPEETRKLIILNFKELLHFRRSSSNRRAHGSIIRRG
jgi:hypothetical protein